MTHEALTAAEPKMVRATEAMERDFAAIRTGRASTALVERIPVDYYGTATPLNQIAGISTPDAHLIVIQPWDRSVLSAIEKAITKSDIGLMPNVDGTVVRLNVPPLTEERRKEMVKNTKKHGEECKVAVRKHRRDAMEMIATLDKDGDVPANDADRAKKKVEDQVAEGIKKIDDVIHHKEKEIMDV